MGSSRLILSTVCCVTLAIGAEPATETPAASAQSPSVRSPSAQSPSAQSPSAQSPSVRSPSVRSAAAPSKLQNEVRELIGDSRLSDEVSFVIQEASSGRRIFEHLAQRPRNPASNMKLLTAAVALDKLGAEFTFLTGLHGQREGAHVPRLTVLGLGDPSLTTADLMQMAYDLYLLGIRSVGEVAIDGSYFDSQALPPAFEQQPKETAAFRAPVSAFAVNHNAFLLQIFPSTSGGHARAALDGASYFQIDNQLKTKPTTQPNVIAVESTSGGKRTLKLRGAVPPGEGSIGFRRRVDDPLIYGGHVVVDALRRIGIRSSSNVVRTKRSSTDPLLVRHRSEPLAIILSDLGKHSDNFVAEQLTKVVAAESGSAPGSTQLGTRIMLKWLSQSGANVNGCRIVNGSGLYEGNLVTAAALSQLLRYVYSRADLRPEYLAHLAVSGRDGTLARRLKDLPRPRQVRAKTGTLDDAIALSGYMFGRRSDQVVTFSFLANGVKGQQWKARDLADRLLRMLAGDKRLN